MKLHFGKNAAALSAACLLGALPADAALVAYSPGDILMGIRATAGTGSGTTYVVNLGAASGYRDAIGVDAFNRRTLDLGNIGTDLAATFGANWASRTDLNWGIAGTSSNTATVGGDAAGTLYLSRSQSSATNPPTAPTIDSETLRLGVSSRMVGAADTFDSYEQSTNSLVAAFQGSTDPNGWRSYMATGSSQPGNTPGNTDFGAGINIEATPGRQLALFRLDSNAPGSYEGYFSIGGDGTVTFVPEPASAALAGLGIALAAFRRRRPLRA